MEASQKSRISKGNLGTDSWVRGSSLVSVSASAYLFLRILNMSNIEYSEKYFDDEFEYRQVILPREWGGIVKEKGLLSEDEWRKLGISQSKGWNHYGIHLPEPHILLFRRPLGTDPRTGDIDLHLRDAIKKEADNKRKLLSTK